VRRVTVIIVVIVFAGLVLLVAAGAQRWGALPLKAGSNLTSAVEPAVAPTVSAQQNRKLPPRISGEEITLRPTGFFPKEIRREKEPFILTIDNLTGLDGLSFHLTRDSGEKHGNKKLQGQKTWRQLLDLNPGLYILREETHPEWVCRLTITAK